MLRDISEQDWNLLLAVTYMCRVKSVRFGPVCRERREGKQEGFDFVLITFYSARVNYVYFWSFLTFVELPELSG